MSILLLSGVSHVHAWALTETKRLITLGKSPPEPGACTEDGPRDVEGPPRARLSNLSHPRCEVVSEAALACLPRHVRHRAPFTLSRVRHTKADSIITHFEWSAHMADSAANTATPKSSIIGFRPAGWTAGIYGRTANARRAGGDPAIQAGGQLTSHGCRELSGLYRDPGPGT